MSCAQDAAGKSRSMLANAGKLPLLNRVVHTCEQISKGHVWTHITGRVSQKTFHRFLSSAFASPKHHRQRVTNCKERL